MKKRILRTFDAWIRQPAKRIDLIRTSTGTPIYFEAIENGHHVCQIDYQLILNNVKR